ncbi:MAG TPA: hypothetical protein VIG25_24015 [Pyrinomonadaceae bacterium]|jgi:hypothetical protein
MKALFQFMVLSGLLWFGLTVNVRGQAPSPDRVAGKAGAEPVVTALPRPVKLVPSVTSAQSTPVARAAPAVSQPKTAQESLRSAKRIFVRSSSILVGQSVIETKLRNRREFQQLGLMITRDPNEADLVLELHHDIFTKYVFTAIDPWTNVVVASGKLSSLGGTVAGKVAERFMKQMMKAR